MYSAAEVFWLQGERPRVLGFCDAGDIIAPTGEYLP
jgi:hypothetical protein